MVWDAGSSGRKEVYPEYKAGRAKRPTLLGEQWPHFEPLVEAFGYRNVHVDGFEADDVIASIAEQARTADPPIPTVIVTGDRDAFQLIDPEGVVRVMATSRGITETKMYDHEAVVERYGIPPELIPDFYGLKGDTSDNIPGVPGIGDKTASQLLQQWGDLDGVLGHIDDISGAKRKQNLTEHADPARVSKELATIRRDIPVDVDVAAEASRSRTAPGCATSSASSSCATRCAAWRRCSARTRPRRASVPTTTVGAEVREGTLIDLSALPDGGAGARRRAAGASRRASCSASTGPWRFGAPATRSSSPARRAARRTSSAPSATGRSSPTTPSRSTRCRRTSSTTPCSAPTCSSPPAAATRSASSWRSAVWPRTSRTPSRATPC